MTYLNSPFRLFLATVALVLFGSLAEPARAQGPGNGGPQPGATTVPIDGGTSLLLAAGAAYGLKRLRQARSR